MHLGGLADERLPWRVENQRLVCYHIVYISICSQLAALAQECRSGSKSKHGDVEDERERQWVQRDRREMEKERASHKEGGGYTKQIDLTSEG